MKNKQIPDNVCSLYTCTTQTTKYSIFLPIKQLLTFFMPILTMVETSCYRRLSDLGKLSCNRPMHLRAREQITGS